MAALPDPELERDPQPTAKGVSTRRTSPTTRWLPVEQLSPLARALLSPDLGGRDVVPQHVADRVNALSEEWAAHGFTHETVQPWLEVPPAAAAYLASRDVDPGVLDRPVEAIAGRAPVTVGAAIASGRLPVEQAYELLLHTDEHRPKTSAPNDGGQPNDAGQSGAAETGTAPAATPVAPALFSHAAADREASGTPGATPNHKSRPHQSPFLR